MLWTLIAILMVLWLLGTVTSYAAGGLLHLLMAVAVAVLVVRLLPRRRPPMYVHVNAALDRERSAGGSRRLVERSEL